MLFSRIRCHFCGSKQPHSRDVVEFQCSQCEAHNYLDGRGNIVDTPLRATSPPPTATTTSHETRSFLSFTKPLPETLEHQQQQAFCRTCTQNQHLYNRILAEYIPEDLEEGSREWRLKMRALPNYKAELELKYPQVCKKCAATAQSMINRADYYAMSQNAAKLVQDTRRRGGKAATRTRDSTDKKFMRNLLRLIALVLFMGFATQIAFHGYGILLALFGRSTDTTEDVATPDPSLQQCVQQTLKLSFTSPCYGLFRTVVPKVLALSAIFIWYNPGIKEWYHHTQRVEAINGQQTYFYMQLIILLVRIWSWYTLSTPSTTTSFDKERIAAIHGFTILFMLITQAVATRNIEAVQWTMKGKIMPKPNELDVLGASAGPAHEHYTPKPSSKDPWKYLRRDEAGPFDINSLAPKAEQPVLRSTTNYLTKQPSPEFSDYGDDVDAMETDDRPVMRSLQRLMDSRPNLQPRHTYMNHTNAPPLGFNDVRNQLSGVSSQYEQEQERLRQEQAQKLSYQPQQRQSPFYGSLPPAPMSMERRLRNPVFRPAVPEQVPLSQQKDFMAQMRRGVKPVTFPEKGTNFQLKQSSWVLPGDVKEVGIEDRFTKSFSLEDDSPRAAKKGFFGNLFG
ncbi:Putative integral inner nuclear membrane protein ima1 [Septoria linicola]|uniref:Integral inner nuclear membrane protein ima1 n=1 Tax=Septoria linicola TaxID=215465 RepID=A0A9Q9EP98_9PEZI|nr:Putative integral inner nuclear membrane protein ima1 [Septoria linicola]